MGIIPQRGSEALIVASLLVERATVVEITGHDIPSTGSKRVLGLNLELRVTELRNPRTEAAKPQTHTPLSSCLQVHFEKKQSHPLAGNSRTPSRDLQPPKP